MKNFLKNRKFFNILLLFFLAGFLILPTACLLAEFENITQEELGKYLELPQNDAQKLINTLIQVFTNEKVNLWASGYSTDEKIAVNEILLKVVSVEVLNHLLIDAPIETTKKIIKGAIQIAQIILAKDLSVVLDKFEKETVKRAIEFGMSTLFQNEIRVTPGATKFRYLSYRGEEREVIFQYVMIYKPINAKSGNVAIKFYSPYPIEAPKSLARGALQLQRDLPPFTVDIQGMVEDYKWVGKPSVKIDFPPTVPDLGIKPLSFWEKQILKPIIAQIKEIEIIITKVTGKSPKITNIIQVVTDAWDKLKSTLSEFNPFKAAVVPAPEPPVEEIKTKLEEIEEVEEEVTELKEELPEIVTRGPDESRGGRWEGWSPKVKTELEAEPKPLTLDEIQEMLDDIAERIDVLSQEIAQVAKERGVKLEELVVEEAGEKEGEGITEEPEIEEKELAGPEEEICQPNSINLNTASAIELEKLTEVGPVLAQRIIEARPFYSLSDLIRVSGIGEATLQKIIAQGCAYVEGFYLAGSVSAGGGGAPLPPSYPKILITEIQILPIDQRFIELYNPNSQEVNLTGWYLQRKTATGADWTSLVSSTHFEGKILQPNSHFLITRSSMANSDIVKEDLTLTEDNVILLENPNREIVDKVGWGQSQDFETASAPNSQTGKSIGRKWDEAEQKYKDEDNNSTDFEIQTPTPKAKNQSPTSQPQDTTPPLVTFNLSSLQTTLSFTISWSGEDPVGNVSPSGIEGFQLGYSESKENWNYWPSETEYTQDTQYTFIGEDEHTYYFQVKAKDKAGNESQWVEASTKISLPKTVVISEVQIADDEFVELYNFGDQVVDVSNWYFSYFSSDDDWNDPSRNWQFLNGVTIPAISYYLIGIFNFPDSEGNPNSDWQVLTQKGEPYKKGQLSNKKGAIAIFPWNPKEKTAQGAEAGRIDALGWAEAKVFEGNPTSVPTAGKSLQRTDITKNSDNNLTDFEIKDPTPTNSKGKTKIKTVWQGGGGENKVNALILAGNSLFAGLETSPGKIIKIDSNSLTTQAIWTATPSLDGIRSLAFDGNYLYAGSNNYPARIVKIDPNNLETIGLIWEGNPNFDGPPVNLSLAGNFLYAGISSGSNTTKIIKINLTTMNWGSKEYVGPSGVIKDLVFVGNSLFAAGPGPGGVYKIDPNDLSVQTYNNQAAANALTFNGNYLYASFSQAGIAKMDLSSLGIVTTSSETGGTRLFYDGQNILNLLYDKITKIDPSTLELKETLLEGENFSTLTFDENYYYIGFSTLPAKIIKRPK